MNGSFGKFRVQSEPTMPSCWTVLSFHRYGLCSTCHCNTCLCQGTGRLSLGYWPSSYTVQPGLDVSPAVQRPPCAAAQPEKALFLTMAGAQRLLYLVVAVLIWIVPQADLDGS